MKVLLKWKKQEICVSFLFLNMEFLIFDTMFKFKQGVTSH